jgi:hypothetical protein
MPVANPSDISPEEMLAIPKPAEGLGQNDIDTVSQAETVETMLAQDPEPIPEKPVEKDPMLSKQFAQLARQEKAMRAKLHAERQAIEAERKAFEAQKAELESKTVDYSKGYYSRDQLKQNALLALAEAGVSIDDLTQQALNVPKQMDPRVEATINDLRAQIDELKSQNEKASKSQVEREQAQYQAALQQIKTDIKAMVSQDDTFEMIKLTNSHDDVVDLIERNYKENGVVMSNEDAAQAIEDYLVDGVAKLARAKKVQSRLKPVAPVAARAQQQALQKTQANEQTQQPKMKTLTNAVGSTRQLSARDRAILAFKGEKT